MSYDNRKSYEGLALTISSIEVASILGRVHRNVIRDIRSRGDINFRESSYVSAQNKVLPMLELSLSDAMVFIGGTKTGGEAAAKFICDNLENIKSINDVFSGIDIDPADDQFIYAIEEVETGNIKIGVSSDPEARVKQLQTGNSSELRLKAIIGKGGRSLELAIHKKLSDIRISGEWFKNESIKRISSGN